MPENYEDWELREYGRGGYGYAMEGIQTIDGIEGLCYKHECVFYFIK